MEIRVGPVGTADDDLVQLAVTMRTPGNDFELAAGFVVTEGIVGQPAAIVSVAYCGLPAEQQEYNIVTVRSAEPIDVDRQRRNVFTTSSCGICGKASIDAVEVACHRMPVLGDVDATVVAALPDALRGAQDLFSKTGGLHAAGLFTPDGDRVAVREDIGRHNAVDKVIGWAAFEGRLPLDEHLLAVSGRCSFEIVQKAAMGGIGLVVGVSAPSSLAIAAADRLGMTLAGFARDGRFNAYTRPGRVVTLRAL